MDRLAGIDAAFLYLETPSAHMHVTGTILLDPGSSSGSQRIEEIANFVAGRIGELPLFRKRVLEVPLGLAHPLWIDQPDFDPRDHLRYATAGAPGGMDELARMVGRIAGHPLDRQRPLWQMWVVDGLEGGHIALITKIHHALLDGVAGARIMAHLFDLEPEPERSRAAPASTPRPAPTASEMLGATLASLSVQPLRLARTVIETGRALLPLVGTALDGSSIRRRLPTLPFTAPRTIFSGAISPERAVAFGKAALEDVRRIKNAFGVTVNDVVLAGCAQALRRYLIERDALPDRPLVATIPVSLDQSTDQCRGGNRVSAMFVSLPVHVADPVIQLLQIARDTRRAKRLHHAIGGEMLGDWIQHAPAAIFSGAAKLYSKFRLADRMPPIHSLVISNVPGPPMPLYAGGARVLAAYPLGPVLEGAAVNITVLSYQGSVDFGVIACRQAVPDPWTIASGFEQAIGHLRAIADVELELTPELHACA